MEELLVRITLSVVNHILTSNDNIEIGKETERRSGSCTSGVKRTLKRIETSVFTGSEERQNEN
jgi:hypothetical protein